MCDETFTRQFNLDRRMLRASHTSFASSLATLEDAPREVCRMKILPFLYVAVDPSIPYRQYEGHNPKYQTPEIVPPSLYRYKKVYYYPQIWLDFDESLFNSSPPENSGILNIHLSYIACSHIQSKKVEPEVNDNTSSTNDQCDAHDEELVNGIVHFGSHILF